MEKTKNRKHSEEFKKEAVRLALESGKPKAVLARELGISVSLLYAWIKKYDEATSRGLTVEEHKAEQEEMKRLKFENKKLQQEIAILKKAAAYFAKDQL